MTSHVAILRTSPDTVVEDYGRLMRLAKYDQVVRPDQDLILKLNLSWTKYYPACSSQPWQLDGVLAALLADGFDRSRVFPVENKTVVTNPVAGCRNNRWQPVLRRHGLPFIPLPEVEWIVHTFKSPLLKLNAIFPEGIQIPKMFVGRNVLHLPTVKCVHPDTEIVLADGRLVRAEALVKECQERQPARELPDGDRVSEGQVRVVSLAGGALTGGHATHFWRTPLTEPSVWVVRTRTGRQVTTSRRHPFLTPDGWVAAERLRVGDRIAVARRIRIEGESQPLPHVAWRSSPAFWRWMGYVSARGRLSEAGASACRLSFAHGDPDVRRDYVALCRALFEVEPRTRRRDIHVDAGSLRLLFEALGWWTPGGAGTAGVPDVLFRCPDAELAAFLQGYLDAAGRVGRDGVGVTLADRRLAGRLQMLLCRLGVTASLGPTAARARRAPGPTRVRLSIAGDDVLTLAGWVRFHSGPKRRRLERLSARVSKRRHPSPWDSIPVPLTVLRRVQAGLGLPAAPPGRRTSTGTHARGGAERSRAAIRRLVDWFRSRDRDGRFAEEIAHLASLAGDDIAWDHVVEIGPAPGDGPFLYDLSVAGSHSFVGDGVILHNTHGHSVTTGAIKNSFGGLLKEVRHYAHEFIHEVMVDLMYMQRELHPGVFAVMDGTVMGDGAGPRTMVPRVGNVILASADQVAIDAIAARIMGFDPLAIPYLRMCHERGLGVADPRDIELVGDPDAAELRMGFKTSRSLVIWGDQLIRRGPLRPLKHLLLHSPLVVWAPFASNVYHDLLWYPTVGRARIRAFAATPWGRLFQTY